MAHASMRAFQHAGMLVNLLGTIPPVQPAQQYVSGACEEANLWTKNNIFIIHLLYAESLARLGFDREYTKYLNRDWIIVRFGSVSLFDQQFFQVGNDILYFDDEIEFSVVLLPLLKSVVLGSGLLFQERELDSYLERVRDTRFDFVLFNEPEFFRFWRGGFFSLDELHCLQ